MDAPLLRPDLSLLLVEDDERSGHILAELLREDGYEVEVCTGGRSGVERLGRDPLPDVLLTDLRMPSVDGAAVVRQARGRRAAMPVLVVTAYPQLLPKHEAGPAPQLFIKPLDYYALLATLAELQAQRDAGG
jgi:CheY-like chemotaxis protein